MLRSVLIVFLLICRAAFTHTAIDESSEIVSLWCCIQRAQPCRNASFEAPVVCLERMNVSSAFYPFAKFDGSSSSASNYVWLNNGFSNEVAVGQFAARNFLGDHSQESDYGILVLNGGTGELVQWELVDVEGGVTMLADANASMTALSTIIPITNSLHLYLFDACEYSGLSSSFFLARANVKLRFQMRSTNAAELYAFDCEKASLYFAIIKFGSANSTLNAGNVKKIDATNCKECMSWKMSPYLFRICPDYFPHDFMPFIAMTSGGEGNRELYSKLNDSCLDVRNKYVCENQCKNCSLGSECSNEQVHCEECAYESSSQKGVSTTPDDKMKLCIDNSEQDENERECFSSEESPFHIESIQPSILDFGIAGQLLTVTMSDTNNETIHDIRCYLKSFHNVSLSTVSITANIALLKVDEELLGESDFILHCALNNMEVESKKPISVASYSLLVQHQTPIATSFETNATEKIMTIVFWQSIVVDTGTPFCYFGNDTQTTYAAFKKTPTTYECNISPLKTPGRYLLRLVRFPAILQATNKYQIPMTVIIGDPGEDEPTASATTATTTTTTTTTQMKSPSIMETTPALPANNDLLRSAVFGDSLSYVDIILMDGVRINDAKNCLDLFPQKSMFGAGSKCCTHGDTITITLGKEASILPGQRIEVNSDFLTTQKSEALQNCYDSCPLQPHKELVQFSIAKPSNPVSPSVIIDSSGTAIACDHSVNITVISVSGVGNRNVSYRWITFDKVDSELSEFLRNAVTRTITVPRDLITKIFTIYCEVCNFAAVCAKSNPLPVTRTARTAQLSVVVSGIPATPVPSVTLKLRAVPRFTHCNTIQHMPFDELDYAWYINGKMICEGSVCYIAPFTLRSNEEVSLRVLATYDSTDGNSSIMAATYTHNFSVGMEPLIVEVDGFDRSISNDQPIVIDASASHDPNSKSGIVQHNWTCINLSNGFGCLISNVWTINWNVSVLRIPAFALNPALYLFVDNITADPLNAYARVYVKVLSSHVPSITLVELSQQRPNIDQYVRVIALVQSKSWPLYFSWHMRSNEPYSYVDLPGTFPDATGELVEPSTNSDERVVIAFTIPPANTQMFPNWTGLAPGAIYCLCFEANNSAGQSFSEIAFRTNEPPTIGVLNLSPSSDIVALETPVTLSLGDGWTDLPEDLPFSYRFGVRHLGIGNTGIDRWEGVSTQNSLTKYFASAWPEPHVICDVRTGYQGLVQVCDRHGACSRTHTASFFVQHPINASAASNKLLSLAEHDILSGDVFGALSKLNAIRLEHCDSNIGESYANRVVTAILRVFKEYSDVNDFWEQISWALLMSDRLSESVTQQLYEVLEQARLKFGFSAVRSRRKRQLAISTSELKLISEDQASLLMYPFDTLLAANKSIVAMYLQNVIDVMSSFCRQVGTSRIMKAAGAGLTFVQAQGVTPGNANFLNSTFLFAGETRKMVSMTAEFKHAFSNYQCGTEQQRSVCMQICLGTAQITSEAFSRNAYLRSFIFSSTYNMIDFNRSASNFYQVSFLDPISGQFVTLNDGAAFRISIPLKSFRPSHYYACFVYIRGVWSNSQCKTSNARRTSNTTYAVECECTSTGIISIFIVNPPIPPSYPLYNDILLTFLLTSSPMCNTADRAMFVSQISAASGVSAKRFVNVMCINDGNPIVSATLRAPFRPDQCENSYAVQAIKRAVDGSEGGLPVFTSSYAISVNASVVHRVMNGDGNARRMSLLIDRSFKDVIGNDSAASATRWLQSIAATTRVSIYRFKNPHIFVGIIFNFTITVPFEQELNPISAEEIALIIIEDTQYGELVLEGRQGEPLPVEVATLADVTELIPTSESNTLVLVLAIVVSTFFIGSSTVVAFLVILKIRTDRLLSMRERLVEQARTIMVMPRETPRNHVRFQNPLEGPSTSGPGAQMVSYHI